MANDKIIQLQFPIGIPFAENGAKTSVPETSGDGSVSYDQGYTASYDLPPADGGRFARKNRRK